MRLSSALPLLGGLLLASCGRAPVLVGADGAPAGDLSSLERQPAAADHRPADGGTPDRAAPPLPDLVVSAFTASVSGSTVTYAIKVCNTGSADAAAFRVDLYYQSTSAPQPKQAGDQSQAQKPLLRGACGSLNLQRLKVPNGTSQAWVQLDGDQAVAESDESNNVFGPLAVVVKAPPLPDLTITKLDATVTGTDIVYDVTVCNQGTALAILFRVDLYYSRVLAPGTLQVGDVSHYVLALGAGDCQSFSNTYKGPPVGLYNSWAFVDTLGTVAESDEGNNVAGPRLLTVVPPGDCLALCVFATTCGDFQIAEYPQCLTWCNQLGSKDKPCATQALQTGSCSALTACKLPPLPPAPPVPWDCLPLCNFLIGTCKLVPQSSLITCVAGCLTLPSTKLQCGLDAVSKQQCVQLGLCIL